MSDAKSPQATPSQSASAGKPKSSPVGRILIGILLVVVGIEAVPYIRMSLVHAQLSQELKKAEQEDHKITAALVKKILGGREPDLSKTKRAVVGDERYDVYYFNGLLKRRELCVHYGVKGKNDPDETQRDVIEVTTIFPEELMVDDEPVNPKFSTPPADVPQAAGPQDEETKTEATPSVDNAAPDADKTNAEPSKP